MNQSLLFVFFDLLSSYPPVHAFYCCTPLVDLSLYTTPHTWHICTTAAESWNGNFRIFGILTLTLSLIASIVAMAWGTVEKNWSALSFDGIWSIAYDEVRYYRL